MSKFLLEIKVAVDWQKAIDCGVTPNKATLEHYMRDCSARIRNILKDVFGEGTRRNPYVTITSELSEVVK